MGKVLDHKKSIILAIYFFSHTDNLLENAIASYIDHKTNQNPFIICDLLKIPLNNILLSMIDKHGKNTRLSWL